MLEGGKSVVDEKLPAAVHATIARRRCVEAELHISLDFAAKNLDQDAAEHFANQPKLKQPNLAAHAATACFDKLRRVPHVYNTEMSKRTFGYEMQGWPWNRAQVSTKKPVSSSIKQFVDEVLLEGLIPDNFLATRLPATMWRKLQKDHFPKLGP